MRKLIALILICISFGLFADDKKIDGAGGLKWFTMYKDAVEDAKERDTVLLVNFTGSDWCHWCFKLDEDVFSKDDFHKWQEENVTLLMIDFPQNIVLTEEQKSHNQMLASMYGIQGFPTIVILSADGSYLGRTGYGKDVNQWIKNIEEMIDD